MAKSYEMDMCSGSVLRKMLLFTLPLMCSSVLQLLFNAADIVVVGQYAGDTSIAAVGANSSLINLLTNLFIGLSVGANVLAARYYGANEPQELSRTVHTAMLLSLLSGCFLTLVGLFGAREMLTLMNTPDNVLPLAIVYLRLYFLGMPAMMIYNFGSAVLRAVGDTKRPLYFLLLAGVVNVLLNLLFVIVFHMGVAGVAVATVISQYISGGLVVRCLLREQGGMRLTLSALRIHRDKLLAILQVGLPAGFQGVVFALSNVVIQSSINLFGDIVIAGNSAAANLEGFVYVAMNAFHQAVVSFTSQNYGAGKHHRLTRITVTGEVCVFVVGLVLGLGVLLLGRPLLGIYSDTPAVADAGMRRMEVILTTYFFCGMMDVMVGALRGIGYSVMPMLVSLIGACGLRLVWIATVFQVERFHNVTTIYLSYPVSWAITFLVHVLCYLWARNRLKRRLLPAETPAA